MKKLLTLGFVVCLGYTISAQSTNDIMVGGGFDFIKTDNQEIFDKAQIGFEANYFVVRHFAVTVGAEVWTRQDESFVMGARWYGMENVFVRLRGLIGDNDVAIGGGYSKPLTENLRVEAMGDFYVDATEFGVRVGVSYILKK